MGSFNATCSISDLSITCDDDMYIQLLLPTWVTNPYSIDGEKVGCGEKGLRVSNERALSEFVPFGFPISGKYADYGDMDDIEKDDNVKMLEEFFNISILDIISCATDDRWYKYSYLPSVENKEEESYENEFKSWTVGDNKMENINILKKLTVTYFRKEHYDFLSESHLDDFNSYYSEEYKKSLDKMVNMLAYLEKQRPPKSKQIKKTIKDITPELKQQYNKVFITEHTDEEILELLNHVNEMWWISGDFEYTFYIPSLARINMFKVLPIGVKDAENVKKQYIFISNMGSLFKVIRPSHYGSQRDNYKEYVKFHKFSTELVSNVTVTEKNDTILSEISYVLKRNLDKIDNTEIANKIIKDIKEDLDIYGYEIDL